MVLRDREYDGGELPSSYLIVAMNKKMQNICYLYKELFVLSALPRQKYENVLKTIRVTFKAIMLNNLIKWGVAP